MTVDAYAARSERRDLFARNERTTTGVDRSKLSDRLAVACDNEGLTCRHGVDHFGVVITQFSLRDSPGHLNSVAECATRSYGG